MKKLFENPVFAVLFSLLLICVSSHFSIRMKLDSLAPEQIVQYASQFPGRILIGSKMI